MHARFCSCSGKLEFESIETRGGGEVSILRGDANSVRGSRPLRLDLSLFGLRLLI
ncbi:hypothetical protein VDG1235_1648 [Verrucomicrobiia bacterium DG1235]|nr:hypothetical protein VDG1235_1648 [Verrucomicrobiae bacterium DG1235]